MCTICNCVLTDPKIGIKWKQKTREKSQIACENVGYKLIDFFVKSP